MFFEDGVYTVMVTPFTEENKIDYKSYQNLLEKQINNKGVQGIILMGTTSESPTLTEDEKVELVHFTHTFVENQKKIILGIGGNNTDEVIRFGNFCKEYCDGMMVTVPNYNKPTQEGIYRHFTRICKEFVEIPIIMYNIPSRCGVNMTADTVARIYNDNSNVEAIKEASGSIDQAVQIASRCDIKIFSGDDGLILPLMSVGGRGVISVASNVIPDVINQIVQCCLDNDFKRGMEIYYKVQDFLKKLFIETNPVPVKTLMATLEMIENGECRMPLCEMEEENKTSLIESYKNMLISFTEGKEVEEVVSL